GVMHQVPMGFHLKIMGLLGLWALSAVACQAVLRRGISPDRVRLVWLAFDAVFLTAVLVVDEAFQTPLALGYGVLIVGSGLWFRVRLVWYTTAMAIVAYLALMGFALLHDVVGESPQHHLIILVILLILGWMVATQVQRVRALSRYYEHRPLP